MGAEAFSILAILEARDKASEIFTRVDETLNKFSETAKAAADTARAAGEEIDQGLLQTASGADALDLADARVSAAQQRLAAATQEQAAAERELLAAQAAVADGADVDAAAADRQVAAADRLAVAQRDVAAASKELSTAETVQADTQKAVAASADETAASEEKAGEAAVTSSEGFGKMGKAAGMVALGLAAAGAVMVKAAGNFQDATTHLVTDAGESAKNLAMVQDGILRVSTATGQSASLITQAMYHIESSGYHGATGLKVLKVAAEGARVGGAQLDTVSKTLVGALNAYYGSSMTAGNATRRSTQMMNELIATVGSGDMKMQDLASALSAVTPVAAAAHISFAQVGGAIATMTSQGMSADQATQDLAHTIRSLQAPNTVAVNEMQQLGVQAQSVAQDMGRRGLTGTIGMLTQAVTRHMGKAGLVIMNAFNQSKVAAQDANTMLTKLPASVQGVAQSFMKGTVSYQTWYMSLKQLSPMQRYLANQFATMAEKAHGFNNLLTSGLPAAQTYTAAMYKMLGGATGLNTALMLSGARTSTFTKNVATVAAAARHSGRNVDKWSTIQGTFNFKMESAKVAIENTGIAIGSALLPAATALLQGITRIVEPIAEWTARHRTLTLVLFGTATALTAVIAAVSLAGKAYRAYTGAVEDVKKALGKAAGLFRSTAAAETAAAEEGAAAQEGAAAETSASWVASAARTVGAWAVTGAQMIGQAAVWVAQSTAKVAVVVAENIAGAAVTAAAWIAANAAMLAGVGLLVVAIAAAVYLIVTHWKTITKTVSQVWDAVYRFTSEAVTAVISFIRSHWRLIISIVGGPLGIAVALVTKYWGDIKRWFSEGVHEVASTIDWFARLPGLFDQWLIGAAEGVARGGMRVLTWFESLPGRVLNLVASLPGLLFSSGEHIIESLASGIISAAGSALSNAMSSVANTVKSFLPFSPAKRGPLAGAGDPSNSGRSIARNLATGIMSGRTVVAAAAQHLAQAVNMGVTQPGLAGGPGMGMPAGPAGRTSGGVYVTVDLRGAQVMSERDMQTLVTKIGSAVATRIAPQAGLHFNF